MNERLKELYLQAHSIRRYDGDPALDGNPPTVYWQGEISAQRFAELILERCVEVADNYVKDCLCTEHVKCNHPKSKIGIKIKQHFGVEE